MKTVENRRRWTVAALVAALVCLGPAGLSTVHDACAADKGEVLRYEVTWNGNKAGHGDITTTADSKQINVCAQAVSDGYLRALVEIWSRVQATFTARTFRPQSYRYQLKSNRLRNEVVDLLFDHSSRKVQVDKHLGDNRESHSEDFAGLYDPITAVWLLRHQKDFSKPMFVDIYDGRDKARLYVNLSGSEPVKLRTGIVPAVRLDLRLEKLGREAGEIGTGKLWISDDQNRIPLLLTSSPVVGTIRFELVHAQL